MQSRRPSRNRILGLILGPLAWLAAELAALIPALFVAAGVFLVAAGLFNYVQPVAQANTASPTPVAQLSSAPYTLPASGSAVPSGSAAVLASVATRVVIPALGIDLPVVAPPPNEQFPLCDVAEYLVAGKTMGYPGLPQAVYLYAHARTGMFLPLLTQSQVNDGQAMIGLWVEVYTDDNQRHVYEIGQVIRHAPATSAALVTALAVTTDQLWLQTSEGPLESSTKLEVVANPVGEIAAAPADAHPTGQGSVCPDAPFCKTSDASGCRTR
jgi:hypothetical protein